VVGVGGAELEVEAALDVGEGVAGADEGQEHVVHRRVVPPARIRGHDLALGGKGIFSSGRRWRRVVSNWGWGWNRGGDRAGKGAWEGGSFLPAAARRPPPAAGAGWFRIGGGGDRAGKERLLANCRLCRNFWK
jgi:hypothetical protein